MKCQTCSSFSTGESKFCSNCGAPMPRSNEPNQQATPAQEATAINPALTTEKRRVKVGGWIVVFCIIITILFPLSSCTNFSEYSNAPLKHGIDRTSVVYHAVGLNAFGFLFIGIYAFVAGCRIWRGSPDGRRIAIVFLIVYPVAACVINFIAIEMLKGTGSGVIGVELLRGIVGSIIFSLIWLSYFKWSKRVRETYS